MKVIKSIRVGVDITADDMVEELINSDSEMQAKFFSKLADETVSFNWCMQSCYISKEVKNKEGVINCLETLLGHMKEQPNDE